MRPVPETAISSVEDEVLPQLTELLRDVFDDPAIVISPDTTAADIAGWDSMAQVRLAVEIEHRFNIKIKSATMEEMRCVRGLIALIKERQTMAAI